MKRRNHFTVVIVYLLVIAAAFSLATARMRAQNEGSRLGRPVKPEASPATTRPEAKPSPVPDPVKPSFSLSTYRVYGSDERARIWANYQGIDTLDFRVYQVDDPVEFFTRLDNKHQMGKEEADESGYTSDLAGREPKILERIREFKSTVYQTVKRYVRRQLRRKARTTFNDKYRSGDQLPLNEADYARMPLLNSDELTLRGAWRQTLAPVNGYAARMIPLGKREPGVYLIEAVNSGQGGDLRAYTLLIVTDLTMIYKTSAGGQILVYVADRITGEPRDRIEIAIVKDKKAIITGKTDRNGILKAQFPKEESGGRGFRLARFQEDVRPLPNQPRPISGVQTDAQGVAESEEQTAQNPEAEPSEDYGSGNMIVMARLDDQFAISDLYQHFGYFGDEDGKASVGALKGYIYTDRPVYRPNQWVYFKGIVRRLGANGYEIPAEGPVTVTIADLKGETIFSVQPTLSPRGTFSGDFGLAADAPFGHCTITARVGASEVTGSFEIAEYKKPDFKARVAAPSQYVPAGAKTTFKVEAQDFFGAPVAYAGVSYYIYRSPYQHVWEENQYDADMMAALDYNDEDGADSGYGYHGDMVKEGAARLDMHGRLEIPFDVPKAEPGQTTDYKYRIEAEVRDLSGRGMDVNASIVGVRASIAVYAAAERRIVNVGGQARIKVKTADYAGHPVSRTVTLKFIEQKWEPVEVAKVGPSANCPDSRDQAGERVETIARGNSRRSNFKQTESELDAVDVKTDERGEATYSWQAPSAGNIEFRIVLREGGKEISLPGGEVYVASRDNRWADFANANEGAIKLVPDKTSYKPGEKALVRAVLPTEGAHLLVTTELHSLVSWWRVDAPGHEAMIEVPIDIRYLPNVYLSVCYVKNGEMYMADKAIAVLAPEKFLKLDIIPDKKMYKPGDSASYTVVARNPDGSPAAGVEVSLGIVDEAVYGVRPDTSGNIRRRFYGYQSKSVETCFSTNFSFTGYSGAKQFKLAQNKRAYQLADFKNENEIAQPKIRKKFEDTAIWKPDLITDAEGKTTLTFDLPDNQTKWRATARAVTSDLKVGSRIVRVVSRNHLMVGLETPRFMTEGDTVTISGLVRNYDDLDRSAQVGLEVKGATVLGQAQQTVTVARNGAQRVDWRISAAQSGDATLRAVARTKTEADGVELPLPIIPFGLKQTSAAAAVIGDESGEKAFTLDLPANSNAQGRSLRIDVSPSIAGVVFETLKRLENNPDGGTEQTASNLLADLILSLWTHTRSNLGEKIGHLGYLRYREEEEEGETKGWGWWRKDKADPFMTAYAVECLVMATRAGDYVLDDGRKGIEVMLNSDKAEDRPLDLESRAYLIYAYAISDRPTPRPSARQGPSGAGAKTKYINDLFARRNELQPYGKAMLALSLWRIGDQNRANQVAGDLESLAQATASGVYWKSTRRPMLDFTENNDLEATAFAVRALAAIKPQSSLLEKAAHWLLANRRNGYYWETTRHTAFATLALLDYLQVVREFPPGYTIEVYLNGEQVFWKQMNPLDTETWPSVVIRPESAKIKGANQIRIVKTGGGPLYASATLDYLTNEEKQASSELKLTREYMRLRVTEAGGKPRWTVEPLTGELRSGDLIVSRLKAQGAPGRYLMIEDPIPASCEQVEQPGGIDLNGSTQNWSALHEARDANGQRTVIFQQFFDGDETFEYALRVRVPGEFNAAPARAEMVYQPAIRASTESKKLSVLDKK